VGFMSRPHLSCSSSGRVATHARWPHAPRTLLSALSASVAAAVAGVAHADSQINLSLVGPSAPVAVKQTIDVKLRATGEPNSSLIGESFVAMDCILRWNPADLRLIGLSSAGSVPLFGSYFPSPANDYTGINESSPPLDGDALYYALAPLGNPVQVSTSGVQVTTFRFRVLRPFASTRVELVPTLTRIATADTVVYDGTVPGLDVTGTLTNAVVVQVVPCPADLDGNGSVDASDLALLLGQWGTMGSADIDGSGIVDAGDLAQVLSSWGSCQGT